MIIVELQATKKKLTDEAERNKKLFSTKIDALSFEKEKATDTKKQAVDDLFKAQKQLTQQQVEIESFNLKLAKLR